MFLNFYVIFGMQISPEKFPMPSNRASTVLTLDIENFLTSFFILYSVINNIVKNQLTYVVFYLFKFIDDLYFYFKFLCVELDTFDCIDSNKYLNLWYKFSVNPFYTKSMLFLWKKIILG